MQRADEKTQLLKQFTQNKTKPIIALPTDLSKDLKMLAYRNVFFVGTPLTDRQFLLDNQIRNGKAGVNVITPFERDDGSIILVDRGWIEFSREQIPSVQLAAERVQIQGEVYIPAGKAFSLGSMDEGMSAWPRLITHLDYTSIGERLGTAIPELTIRMDPYTTPHPVPAYLREWPEMTRLQPDRNRAYAIQWFAMAFTVLILFIVLNFRISDKQK